MSDFRPFVTIDIETNGLPGFKDLKVLEAYLIFDDLGYHGGVKKDLHLILEHKKLNYQSEEVKEMNDSHYQDMLKNTPESVIVCKSVEEFQEQLMKFLKECNTLNDGYPIHLAAKNAGSFLNNVFKQVGVEIDQEVASHRFIDVASLYYIDFGYVPTLEAIIKKFKKNPSGRAIDDSHIISELVKEKIMRHLGLEY